MAATTALAVRRIRIAPPLRSAAFSILHRRRRGDLPLTVAFTACRIPMKSLAALLLLLLNSVEIPEQMSALLSVQPLYEQVNQEVESPRPQPVVDLLTWAAALPREYILDVSEERGMVKVSDESVYEPLVAELDSWTQALKEKRFDALPLFVDALKLFVQVRATIDGGKEPFEYMRFHYMTDGDRQLQFRRSGDQDLATYVLANSQCWFYSSSTENIVLDDLKPEYQREMCDIGRAMYPLPLSGNRIQALSKMDWKSTRSGVGWHISGRATDGPVWMSLGSRTGALLPDVFLIEFESADRREPIFAFVDTRPAMALPGEVFVAEIVVFDRMASDGAVYVRRARLGIEPRSSGDYKLPVNRSKLTKIQDVRGGKNQTVNALQVDGWPSALMEGVRFIH